jgi:hypothetical protein
MYSVQGIFQHHFQCKKVRTIINKIWYAALFTFLVRWHINAVSLPTGDVILALQAYPLNDIIFVYIRNNQPISLQT